MKKKNLLPATKVPLGRAPFIIIGVCFVLTLGFFVGLKYKASSHTPSENPNIKLCFTPGGQCQHHIVSTLANAKKSILVQASSFRSQPIAEALIQAQKRGIHVHVLAARSQLEDKNSILPYLMANEVTVSLDQGGSDLVYNKVFIIDEELVLTGSYTWNQDGKNRNIENLLFIDDPEVTTQYLESFKNRLQLNEKER